MYLLAEISLCRCTCTLYFTLYLYMCISYACKEIRVQEIPVIKSKPKVRLISQGPSPFEPRMKPF